MTCCRSSLQSWLCGSAAGLFLGIIDDHPRYGLDPGNMASDCVDARSVFGRDDRGFALVRGKDDTPQVHNTVPNSGIELRCPRLFGQLGHQLLADRRVGRRPVGMLLAALASACNRSARLTVPTTLRLRMTGNRLIRRVSIRWTTSSSEASSVIVIGDCVITSATFRL